MIRLDATAWVRIGAAGFVVAAVAATAVHVGRKEELSARPAPTAAPADPLAPELARCRALSAASPPDAACERAWDAARRRFLGVAPASGARP